MFSTTTITVTLAVTLSTLLSFISAAPQTPPPTGITHRITAGSTTANSGLHFEPENIVANIGDVIEVHFLPKNHSFAQSSFSEPCKPISDDAIFSGFQPTAEGEAPNIFSFTVRDEEPIWFYCSQPNGLHCKNGMSGVINQNFGSGSTLAKYKQLAALTESVVSPPKPGNGGWISPNEPL
ncbi:hypothetical protein GQ43DRAFT_444412 [Delitschia confertaspora ATCC 74209]|uniref:Extracellular serine-rich protein n=1 Tax=Delitschia confertaspora ATCC 74209 TaxID=1513339 RepID=A0A9P4MLM3_9PLEO|nr:hypothetical protein GQ43DRAFT_444412 [Delitschia confertaspora ATCC 74209]